MNEAHNGYLDVLAQTGIIGILLFGFTLISGFSVLLLVGQNRSDGLNVWKWFAIYVTLGMSFYNLTESTLVKAGSADWMLFVAMVSLGSFFQGIFAGR